MQSSFVRRGSIVLVLAALTACHDNSQAPKTNPPPPPGPQWSLLSMDDGVTDYPSWGGLDLLADGSGGFEGVAVEREYGSLHFASCVTACDLLTSWTQTTLDSGVMQGIGENASSVRSSSGVTIAYEDQQTTTEVKVITCASSCSSKANWHGGDLWPGLLGGFTGSHSRALATGPDGSLSLLYRHTPNFVNLYYARCLSACADSSSWQRVLLDSGAFAYSDAAVTVAPSGATYVVRSGDSSSTVKFFACDSLCTTGGNWTSLVLATGTTGSTPSIVVGPTGTLFVSYGRVPSLATCDTGCGRLANWSFVQVSDSSGTDVALTLDGSGRPWILVPHGFRGSHPYTTVLHCEAGCTTAGSWQSEDISSLGDGLDASMVLDDQGKPRILVSGFGVHYAQRTDTLAALVARR